MKKMAKKVLALAIAAGIVLAFVGAGRSEGRSGAAQAPAAAGDPNIDLSGNLPIIKDPSKFKKLTAVVSVGSDVFVPTAEREEVQRWAQETGVVFDWQEIPGAGAAERVNLMISSNNLPDVFFSVFGNSVISQNIDNGIFVEADGLVENYMPRLREIYRKSPFYKAAMTFPNGKTYSFPYVEEMYGLIRTPGVLYINEEWLAKVGKPMPQTLDEYVDVLKAFRDAGDLNGNGRADEYAFAASFSSAMGGTGLGSFLGMNHFTGLFGRPNIQENKQTDNLALIDGKVAFTAIDPAYRDTAKFFNTLYREKLIDPDSFSPAVDGGPAYLKKITGDVAVIGSMSLWNPDNHMPNLQVKESYKPTPRLTSPKGKSGGVNNNYEMYDTNNCVITTVCQYPEVVAAFIDYLYEPWHSVKANWGKQFVEYPDGVLRYPRYDSAGKLDPTLKLPVTVPDGFPSFASARSNSKITVPLMISNEYYGKVNDYPATTWIFYTHQLAQGKEEILKDIPSLPPMLLAREEQDVISRLLPQIRGIVDKYTTQWILDGNADATWNNYLTELRNSGLEQYVRTYQQAYDRFLGNQ